MFGIGFQEILVILVIALLVLGPRKLPDIAKALGRAIGEFRRASDDIKNSIEREARKIESDYENDKESEDVEAKSQTKPESQVKEEKPS